MESFKNEVSFRQEEGVRRCPHCESLLGKKIFFRQIEDKDFGKMEEEVHFCEKDGCGKETILNRKRV